jgi:hypothetical protein
MFSFYGGLRDIECTCYPLDGHVVMSQDVYVPTMMEPSTEWLTVTNRSNNNAKKKCYSKRKFFYVIYVGNNIIRIWLSTHCNCYTHFSFLSVLLILCERPHPFTYILAFITYVNRFLLYSFIFLVVIGHTLSYTYAVYIKK